MKWKTHAFFAWFGNGKPAACGLPKKIFIFTEKMQRLIKLIWDFKGTTAAKTAEHHEIHLKEFIQTEKIELNITGFEIINELHCIAFMVVTDGNMIPVRDALKPHRGEIFQE